MRIPAASEADQLLHKHSLHLGHDSFTGGDRRHPGHNQFVALPIMSGQAQGEFRTLPTADRTASARQPLAAAGDALGLQKGKSFAFDVEVVAEDFACVLREQTIRSRLWMLEILDEAALSKCRSTVNTGRSIVAEIVFHIRPKPCQRLNARSPRLVIDHFRDSYSIKSRHRQDLPPRGDTANRDWDETFVRGSLGHLRYLGREGPADRPESSKSSGSITDGIANRTGFQIPAIG
ncbi:MAG: hypothetical protein OXI41_09210 [Chloroflexota bacterium]|nr:hypothetical protein [Chloroflexota bacterium]MDE2894574.1 hypothetical protein [Chloroflexota bacterium]